KQWLILGLRRAAEWRRRDRRELGPFLPAIEDRDRFPAVDGAQHVLHVVAKIDDGCVHGVSLYKYTFRQNPPSQFELGYRPIDMCITCLYAWSMSKMIQVRDVPEHLHGTLKARAAREGMTLS